MERANASMRVLIWGAGQGGAGVGVYITVNIGIMHLSIETPTPPPPRAYVGQCGGFLWYLKGWLACGGGGFLRICLAYSWKSMEVGERGGDLTRA